MEILKSKMNRQAAYFTQQGSSFILRNFNMWFNIPPTWCWRFPFTLQRTKCTQKTVRTPTITHNTTFNQYSMYNCYKYYFEQFYALTPLHLSLYTNVLFLH